MAEETPNPPEQPKPLALVIFHLEAAAGEPDAGAGIPGVSAIAESANGDWTSSTDAAGNVLDPGTNIAGVGLQAGDYVITFSKPGWRPARLDPAHIKDCGKIRVGLKRSAPSWPSDLHTWSGAFCIPDAMPCNLTWFDGSTSRLFGDGKRIWTPAYGLYPDDYRREMLRLYRQRPYRMFVYNIASPNGVYHNEYPALADDPARARRDLTEILAAGLI